MGSILIRPPGSVGSIRALIVWPERSKKRSAVDLQSGATAGTRQSRDLRRLPGVCPRTVHGVSLDGRRGSSGSMEVLTLTIDATRTPPADVIFVHVRSAGAGR